MVKRTLILLIFNFAIKNFFGFHEFQVLKSETNVNFFFIILNFPSKAPSNHREAVKDDIPSMIIVLNRSQPEGFGNSGLPAQSGTKDQQWPSYCQYSTGPSSSERVLFWVDWPDCSILVRHRATSELQSAPMCDSGLVWRRPHQNWHGDRN